MKKRMVVTALVCVAVLEGCILNAVSTPKQGAESSTASVSQQSQAKPAQVSAAAAAMNTDLPDWYLNPPEDDGMVYGSGSAKMDSESRTQRAAENRARESVAFQVSALVDAMQRDYTSEGGTDKDPAALNFFAAVNEQLASEVLKNARITKRWKRSDGTLYVQAAYSRTRVTSAFKSVAENPASKLAEAKAKIMIEEMDTRIQQKLKPHPVESD